MTVGVWQPLMRTSQKAARNDWVWNPAYPLDLTFAEYLVPAVRQRYQAARGE